MIVDRRFGNDLSLYVHIHAVVTDGRLATPLALRTTFISTPPRLSTAATAVRSSASVGRRGAVPSLAMATLELLGTNTSPYVRRVRIVAHELGIDVRLVDTFAPEGDAALRAASPIWKVPVARLPGDEAVVLDSHAIIDVLLHRLGPGPFSPIAIDDVAARNVLAVADGALDSLINAFYLRRDGVEPSAARYLDKQVARAHSALAWLEARAGAGPDVTGPLSLTDVAIATALDWMRFRATASLDALPRLAVLLDRCNARPSFATTRPG